MSRFESKGSFTSGSSNPEPIDSINSDLRHTATQAEDYATGAANALADTRREDDVVKDPVSRWLLTTFGLYRCHIRVLRARKRRMSPTYKHRCPWLERKVNSAYFDIGVGVALLANAMSIGMQASSREEDPMYDNLDRLFALIFVTEVSLHFAADGWTWIWDVANLCDLLLIIATAVVPILMLGMFSLKSYLVRAFSVLRIVRLVRLVKLVRKFSVFKVLWSLIQGLFDSTRTFIYAFIIGAIVLYMFAIFGVYLIGKQSVFEDDDFAQTYFGDVPRAMLTFFQVMTLDSWAAVCRGLMKKSGYIVPLFALVILVMSYALLNLVTAVMCTNAFGRAKEDAETVKAAQAALTANEVHGLQAYFAEYARVPGFISKNEYDDALAEEDDVQDAFAAMQISPAEFGEIWDLLDDGTGQVSSETFGEVLRSLRGEAKAKDTFTILRRVLQSNHQVERLTGKMVQYRASAEELRAEATEVRQKLGGLQTEMAEIMQLLGVCIPPRPISLQPEEVEAFADRLHEEVERWL